MALPLIPLLAGGAALAWWRKRQQAQSVAVSNQETAPPPAVEAMTGTSALPSGVRGAIATRMGSNPLPIGAHCLPKSGIRGRLTVPSRLTQ